MRTIKLTQKEGGTLGKKWIMGQCCTLGSSLETLDAYCFGVFEKYYSLIRRKNSSPLKGLIVTCKLSLLGLTPVSAYGWSENKAGRFITECWFSVTHYTLCQIACRMVQPAKIQHYECTSLSSQLWVVWLRGTSLNRDHYLLWIPGWWNRKLICIWIIVLFHLPSMCCYSNRSAALQEHEVFLKPWKGRGSSYTASNAKATCSTQSICKCWDAGHDGLW